MFPYHFDHTSVAADWYCSIAIVLGTLWAVGWIVAFTYTYIFTDWEQKSPSRLRGKR
jgi:hypothetical protein